MKIIAFIIVSQLMTISFQNENIKEIKALFVFNFFETKGYSTVDACKQFDDMIYQNVDKIEATQEDCKQLFYIFRSVQPKKHFQKKLGTKNIFIEIKTEESTIRAIIGVGSSYYVLLDLTNLKEYWIKDKNQEKWINDFIIRMKNNKKSE